MADKNPRLHLEDFDRDRANQLIAYAAVSLPRLVEIGRVAPEDFEAERDAVLALATKLNEDPPHAGQYVVIKRVLSYGDSCDADAAAVRFTEDGRRYIDQKAYELAVTARAIVAWSLLDDDDQPIERHPHSCFVENTRDAVLACAGCKAIRSLAEDLGIWLYQRIDDQRAFTVRSREQMDALKSVTAGGSDAA